MKNILQKRIEGEPLSMQEANEILSLIGRGEVNNSQIAAFLTSYMIYPITAAELEGFRDAMLALAMTIDLFEYDPMDVCGTGGDGKDTFNISTTAAFVVAGAGQNVAKHGNHGVSSSVGSSTVLEYLGLKFTNDPIALNQKIKDSGICFLHAPLFHPAMRFVAPIRKELGMKTFFNMLGPLLNPALVNKQICGVYHPDVMQLYASILQKTNKQFGIVYAYDGYDEISLTSDFQLITQRGSERFSPQKIGFASLLQHELAGGDSAKDSAKILIDILENNGTQAQTNAVVANAAAALYSADPKLSFEDAILKAKESLQSGKAFQSFKKFLA